MDRGAERRPGAALCQAKIIRPVGRMQEAQSRPCMAREALNIASGGTDPSFHVYSGGIWVTVRPQVFQSKVFYFAA